MEWPMCRSACFFPAASIPARSCPWHVEFKRIFIRIRCRWTTAQPTRRPSPRASPDILRPRTTRSPSIRTLSCATGHPSCRIRFGVANLHCSENTALPEVGRGKGFSEGNHSTNLPCIICTEYIVILSITEEKASHSTRINVNVADQNPCDSGRVIPADHSSSHIIFPAVFLFHQLSGHQFLGRYGYTQKYPGTIPGNDPMR